MAKVIITVQDKGAGHVSLIIDSDPPALGITNLTTAQEIGLKVARYARKIFAETGGIVTDANGTHKGDCALWSVTDDNPDAVCDCGATKPGGN